MVDYRLEFPGQTRVAIVGAGYIADTHLEILSRHPDVDVVCICDPLQSRAEASAERYGVPHAVGSLAEVRKVGVQIAHVLSPPPTHAAAVRELLQAGIGCFVEKPLCLSSAEARELGALASDVGCPLGVDHNALHHPAYARLAERVRSGAIGTVDHVQVTLSVPLRQLDAQQYAHWMFQSPENILFEQAVHPFSQLEDLLGAVESCHAQILSTRELYPGQVFHERWVIAVQAERGTAEVYLAFGRPFARSAITVLGSDGTASADLQRSVVEAETPTRWPDIVDGFLTSWRRGGQVRRRSLGALKDGVSSTLGVTERKDPFYSSIKAAVTAFHAAVRAGDPIPHDAARAARVLAWCEAAAEPARAAAPVSVTEPPFGGEPREGEIVVLGGTGFIGRATVQELLDRGLPVTAVVRRRHALPPVLADGARAGRVRLLEGKLEDRASLAAAVKGARVVIHLATGGGTSWEDFERDMVGGTLAVAEACLAEGVERLVYVSSISALFLGRGAGRQPLDDDVPADQQPDGRSLYARGKLETEDKLLELHRTKGLPVVVVRPGVVLGPGAPLQHSGLGLWVRDNHCVGWGLGKNPLPLVGVGDVADALAQLAAGAGPELAGKALNLASRVPLSAREVVAELAAVTGRDLQFHARPLALSQAAEAAKWVIKRVGQKRDVPFPSWRDLASRQLLARFNSRLAREQLGWRPIDDREEFLERVVRPMAQGTRPAVVQPVAHNGR